MTGDSAAGFAPEPKRSEDELLRTELQARIAEAEWLKGHYDEQLRAAFAQIASLQARLRTIETSPPPIRVSRDVQEAEELGRLQAEVERLSAAEQRYLDRIEELKEAIERER